MLFIETVKLLMKVIQSWFFWTEILRNPLDAQKIYWMFLIIDNWLLSIFFFKSRFPIIEGAFVPFFNSVFDLKILASSQIPESMKVSKVFNLEDTKYALQALINREVIGKAVIKVR